MKKENTLCRHGLDEGLGCEKCWPKFNCGSVIGLYEQEALYLIKKAGFHARTLSVDGKQFIATRDYRIDRINLRFINGKVIEAKVG